MTNLQPLASCQVNKVQFAVDRDPMVAASHGLDWNGSSLFLSRSLALVLSLNKVKTEDCMGSRRFSIDCGGIGLTDHRPEVEGAKQVFDGVDGDLV